MAYILDDRGDTFFDGIPVRTLRKVGQAITAARILLNDPTPSGSGSTFSGTATLRTVGGVVGQVRGFLNDTDPTNYRYPDADLYTYFGDALLMLRRFRPDVFEIGVDAALPAYGPGNVNDLFPVEEIYLPAFVQYVTSAASMRDDTTAQEAKVAALADGFVANVNNAPYRYADTFLYQVFTDAIGDARGLRPDLFHGQLRAPAPIYTVAEANDPFPIDDRYFSAVVDYVVGRARWRNRETGVAAGDANAKPPVSDYLVIYQRRLSE